MKNHPICFSKHLSFLFVCTGSLYPVGLNLPALRCKRSEGVMCRQGKGKSVLFWKNQNRWTFLIHQVFFCGTVGIGDVYIRMSSWSPLTGNPVVWGSRLAGAKPINDTVLCVIKPRKRTAIYRTFKRTCRFRPPFHEMKGRSSLLNLGKFLLEATAAHPRWQYRRCLL